MKKKFFTALILLFISVSQTLGAPIKKEEVEYQNYCYEMWWDADLDWKFEELPKQGMVEKHRLPYAGHIYPDNGGGTSNVLRKYDAAFHGGRMLATSFEQRDINIHRVGRYTRGFFGRVRSRPTTPYWAGHCNGWAAAAIRHAEPENNVVRNGVTFTPADIKGLLAELYVYTETEFLGGIDPAINPGTLHVVLTNWVGRGQHPIGMDSTVGREVWNYPIYAFTSSSAKRGERAVEVKVNVGYVDYLSGEVNRAPANFKYRYFHYMLELNDKGDVIGGSYYGDSSRIDMLWAPLQPVQGGKEGNLEGNPHMSTKEVLAMWRESVPEEKRAAWYNINPTVEDRILTPEEEAELLAEEEAARQEAAEAARRVAEEAAAAAEAAATAETAEPSSDDDTTSNITADTSGEDTGTGTEPTTELEAPVR